MFSTLIVNNMITCNYVFPKLDPQLALGYGSKHCLQMSCTYAPSKSKG